MRTICASCRSKGSPSVLAPLVAVSSLCLAASKRHECCLLRRALNRRRWSCEGADDCTQAHLGRARGEEARAVDASCPCTYQGSVHGPQMLFRVPEGVPQLVPRSQSSSIAKGFSSPCIGVAGPDGLFTGQRTPPTYDHARSLLRGPAEESMPIGPTPAWRPSPPGHLWSAPGAETSERRVHCRAALPARLVSPGYHRRPGRMACHAPPCASTRSLRMPAEPGESPHASAAGTLAGARKTSSPYVHCETRSPLPGPSALTRARASLLAARWGFAPGPHQGRCPGPARGHWPLGPRIL